MNDVPSSLEQNIENGELSMNQIQTLKQLEKDNKLQEKMSQDILEGIQNHLDCIDKNNKINIDSLDAMSLEDKGLLVFYMKNKSDLFGEIVDTDSFEDINQKDIETFNLISQNQESIQNQLDSIDFDEKFLKPNEFVDSLIKLDCLEHNNISQISNLYDKIANDNSINKMYKKIYQEYPNVPDRAIGIVKSRIQEKQTIIKEKQINLKEKERIADLGKKVNKDKENVDEYKENVDEHKENVDKNRENVNENRENVNENRENVNEEGEDENKNKELIKNRIQILNIQSQTLQANNKQFQSPEFERQKQKLKRQLENNPKVQKFGLDIAQLASIGATQIILSGLSVDEKNSLAGGVDINNFESKAGSLLQHLEINFENKFNNLANNDKALDTIKDKSYNQDRLDELVDKFGEGSREKIQKFVNSLNRELNTNILTNISDSLGSMGEDINIENETIDSDKDTFLSTKINIDGHQDQIQFQRNGDIYINKFVSQGEILERKSASILSFENSEFNFQKLGDMNKFRDRVWDKVMEVDDFASLQDLDINAIIDDDKGLGKVDDLTKDALEHSLKSQGLQSEMMEFYPNRINIDRLNDGDEIVDSRLSEYMDVTIRSSNRASTQEIEKTKSSLNTLNELTEEIEDIDDENRLIRQAKRIIGEDTKEFTKGFVSRGASSYDFMRVDERGKRYIDFDEFNKFVEKLESQTQK